MATAMLRNEQRELGQNLVITDNGLPEETGESQANGGGVQRGADQMTQLMTETSDEDQMTQRKTKADELEANGGGVQRGEGSNGNGDGSGTGKTGGTQRQRKRKADYGTKRMSYTMARRRTAKADEGGQ